MSEFLSWTSVPDDGQWHKWDKRLVCRVGRHFVAIEQCGNGWEVQFGRKVRDVQGAKRAALVAAVRKANAEAIKLQDMLRALKAAERKEQVER